MITDLKESACNRITHVAIQNRVVRIANVSFHEGKYINEDLECVVSINDPGSKNFLTGTHTLQLSFHDVSEPSESRTHPTAEHMDKLDVFFTEFIDSKCDSILLHCEGGVSRSGAATLFLLMKLSKGNMKWSLDTLFNDVNPDAAPNELMIKEIMERFDCPHLEQEVDKRWKQRQLKIDPNRFD